MSFESSTTSCDLIVSLSVNSPYELISSKCSSSALSRYASKEKGRGEGVKPKECTRGR